MKIKWTLIVIATLSITTVAAVNAQRGTLGKIRNATVADELGLSDEQKTQMKSLRKAHRDAIKSLRASGERPNREQMKELFSAHREQMKQTGAMVVKLPADSNGRLDLHAVLNHLGAIGINTILVEAGTGVTTAMLATGLVDKIYWTQSQHILGADARPVVGPLKLVAMPTQNLYTQANSSLIGQDQLRVFVRDVNQDKTG